MLWNSEYKLTIENDISITQRTWRSPVTVRASATARSIIIWSMERTGSWPIQRVLGWGVTQNADPSFVNPWNASFDFRPNAGSRQSGRAFRWQPLPPAAELFALSLRQEIRALTGSARQLRQQSSTQPQEPRSGAWETDGPYNHRQQRQMRRSV